MTVARTVADVLTQHVTFQVECIDRMFLNVYQPKLQYAAGFVDYVHRRLGMPIASTAPLAKITDRFVTAVHRFADDEHIERVDFRKGQRKDDVMADSSRDSPPARVSCSSAGHRRRPPCSAPRSVVTRTGCPTRGS
jgi:hypothetical protein